MRSLFQRSAVAEIERGLVEVFSRRRRMGRFLRTVGLWGVLGALVVLGCVAVLAAIGAWWAVTTFGMVTGPSPWRSGLCGHACQD